MLADIRGRSREERKARFRASKNTPSPRTGAACSTQVTRGRQALDPQSQRVALDGDARGVTWGWRLTMSGGGEGWVTSVRFCARVRCSRERDLFSGCTAVLELGGHRRSARSLWRCVVGAAVAHASTFGLGVSAKCVGGVRGRACGVGRRRRRRKGELGGARRSAATAVFVV